MYANLEKFRQLVPFKKGDVSDEDLNAMIPFADKAVMRMATTEVYDEKLTGAIDGSNTIFTTAFKPIADRGLDRQISAEDVTVLLATKDAENNRISTETTVSSVSSRDGRIILSSAPNTTNAELGVYADYRYYRNAAIDFDILEAASIYYLAFLVSTGQSQQSISQLSATWATKASSGQKFASGEINAQAQSWLNLCLRTLGLMRARGSGKIANKRVKMKLGFRKD